MLSRHNLAVPSIIARAGEDASQRFREFFLREKRIGGGRQPCRARDYSAVRSFFSWLRHREITELAAVRGRECSAYLWNLRAIAYAAIGPVRAEVIVRQHRQAIRRLFDWLVEGGIMAPLHYWDTDHR